MIASSDSRRSIRRLTAGADIAHVAGDVGDHPPRVASRQLGDLVIGSVKLAFVVQVCP